MLIYNAKEEDYNDFLKRTYWEMHEAAFLLCGIFHFPFHNTLEPLLANSFGLQSYGAIPYEKNGKNISKKSFALYLSNLEKIYKAIQCNELPAHALKIDFSFRHPKGITYLMTPDDVIACAVTKGIVLPKTLQFVANIYQINESRKKLSEASKNLLRRQAIAQIFWFENPKETISGICRKIYEFKDSLDDSFSFINKFDFDFIYKSQNRTRFIVQKLKPKAGNDFPIVSETLEWQKEIVAFDFQKLNVVLDTIGLLLILKNKVKTSIELLNYPLINIYGTLGGKMVEKVLKFSLKSLLEILEQGV